MCAAGSRGLESARRAGVAQLVEQLICNQWVGSSILSAGTSKTRCLTARLPPSGTRPGCGRANSPVSHSHEIGSDMPSLRVVAVVTTGARTVRVLPPADLAAFAVRRGAPFLQDNQSVASRACAAKPTQAYQGPISFDGSTARCRLSAWIWGTVFITRPIPDLEMVVAVTESGARARAAGGIRVAQPACRAAGRQRRCNDSQRVRGSRQKPEMHCGPTRAPVR
jgi:hypothetical protein